MKETLNQTIDYLPEMNINQNIPQQELKETLSKTMRSDPEILLINDLQKTSYIGSRNVKIYLEHDPFYLLRG